MTSFFDGIPTISYDPQADHDFAYRSYNPDEMLMGKTMARRWQEDGRLRPTGMILVKLEFSGN